MHIKKLIITPLITLAMASTPVQAGWLKEQFARLFIPGSGYPIAAILEDTDEQIVAAVVWRDGMRCDREAYENAEAILLDRIAWRIDLETELEKGNSHWELSKKEEMDRFEEWKSSSGAVYKAVMGGDVSSSAIIEKCARKYGYKREKRIKLDGAERWTRDRINEFEEYLPKVACDEQVYNWMNANYVEATRMLPIIEAYRAAGYSTWQSWSVITNHHFDDYKALERAHKDKYKREGKVIRGTARKCEESERATQVAQQSPIEQLEGLKRLLDAGVITEAEFEEKKVRLLEQI